MSGESVRHADVEDVRGPLWEEAVAAGAARGEVVPAGAPDADDADVDLRRYARWQWRDFWRNRGVWLGVGALLGVWLLTYLAWHGAETPGPNGVTAGPMTPENVAGMAHAFFTLGGALAALLGVGGLVSRERERGLQRFLFAKPVRPLRYYLQAFAVHSAGALTVLVGAVLLAAALLGAMVPVGSVLAVALGAYLLTAGVTFLLSTLVRFDAPIAVAWLVAGFPVAAAAEQHWPGVRVLSWLFPQGQTVAVLKAAGVWRTGQHVVLFVSLAVAVAVLYGLLAFAGGVAVLRRRAIST